MTEFLWQNFHCWPGKSSQSLVQLSAGIHNERLQQSLSPLMLSRDMQLHVLHARHHLLAEHKSENLWSGAVEPNYPFFKGIIRVKIKIKHRPRGSWANLCLKWLNILKNDFFYWKKTAYCIDWRMYQWIRSIIISIYDYMGACMTLGKLQNTHYWHSWNKWQKDPFLRWESDFAREFSPKERLYVHIYTPWCDDLTVPNRVV